MSCSVNSRAARPPKQTAATTAANRRTRRRMWRSSPGTTVRGAVFRQRFDIASPPLFAAICLAEGAYALAEGKRRVYNGNKRLCPPHCRRPVPGEVVTMNECLASLYHRTPVGWLRLEADARGLRRVAFAEGPGPDRPGEEAADALLRRAACELDE